MRFRFSRKLFVVSMVLFLILLGIAVFVSDSFIRPFLGDVLVIVWLYLFVSSFLMCHRLPLSLAVLAFAFFVEALQFIKLVDRLDIQNKIIRVAIGSVFDWKDLCAYVLGFACVLLIIQIENAIDKSE